MVWIKTFTENWKKNGYYNFDFVLITGAICTYRTRTIITRGLYTFYPIFEGQKRFLRSFFCNILALCMVSIQEGFQIKSGLLWRAYGKSSDHQICHYKFQYYFNTIAIEYWTDGAKMEAKIISFLKSVNFSIILWF